MLVFQPMALDVLLSYAQVYATVAALDALLVSPPVELILVRMRVDRFPLLQQDVWARRLRA